MFIYTATGDAVFAAHLRNPLRWNQQTYNIKMDGLSIDLGKSIKPASAGKKKEFKGSKFKFAKASTPEPLPRSPQIPWEDVSTLTIQGKKQVCNPSELEICELLGKGAYGYVHRMVHTPTKTVMAVKRFPLTFDTTEKKQTFMDLDVSMRSGSCPYTVQFFGAMIEEGEVWICMELMDLSIDRLYQLAYTNGCEISEAFLRHLAYSVVTALLFLKTELNVIHRDVKPSNILVNRAGQIKICDFGISGYLENSLAMTRIGCKFYMSPERIDPPEGCKGFGIKSDVWSFGITMVEVATGRYPYDSWKDPFHQIKQVVNGPVPTLPSGKYSSKLEQFLTLCLQKQVEDRASYETLLAHPFLKDYHDEEQLATQAFVSDVLDRKSKS